MPFKVFVNGDVPPDTDWNDYLMEQVIIRCTSGTRPGSPNDGMTVFETDTNMLRYYDLSQTKWRSMISTVPMVLLAKTTASIPNNAVTTVNWSSAIRNEFGMWSAGSANLITIPYDGVYRVEVEVQWTSQATAAGTRASFVSVGGTSQMGTWLPMTSSFNATTVTTTCAHTMALTAGEQIEGKVFQTSGAALDMISNSRILVQMLSEG